MLLICTHCSADLDDAPLCPSCKKDPLLRERYALQAVLGEGASGTTYRGRDTESGRDVAIKELAFHRVDSFKAHELFEREAAVLCRLDHPGVPQFFDSFSAGEGKALRFYLVMEFIDGATLEDELQVRHFQRGGALSVVEELGQVCGYLHSLSPPVIHRDIKPSNVMRRSDGSLVLVDFGSVRAALEPDDAGSTIAGTIGYMAPEQLRGLASPASDVYGLATCALHLLTRKPPVELLDDRNALAWEGLVNVSPAFCELLGRMLSLDPRERPANGSAVARAVTQVRRSPQGLPSTPTSLPNSTSHGVTGGRKAAMLAASVSILVMAAAGVGWLTMSSNAPAPRSSSPSVATVPAPQPDEPPAEPQMRKQNFVRPPQAVDQPGLAGPDAPNVEVITPGKGLSRSHVKETLLREVAHMRDDCAEFDNGTTSGRMWVKFHIRPDGSVAWAEKSGEAPLTRHDQCLLLLIEELTFRASKESVTVNFPLIFQR